ncbi:MAG: FAD-dependent oxidoreductase [bacterium]
MNPGDTTGRIPKESRIAIIGAGVSGLTAARTLKKLGYNKITLFEAKDRIGGKVHSIEKDGLFYEMGGVFVPEEFETIKGLASEYGSSLTKKQELKTALVRNGRQVSNFAYTRSEFGTLGTLKSFLRFQRLLARNGDLSRPGFARTDPSMFRSFNEFAKKHEMQAVAYSSAPFLTGMGYGYVDSTPAVYHLKLMKRTLRFALRMELNSVLGLHLPCTYFFEKGYQNLLEKMSADLDIRLGAKARRIVRRFEEGKLWIVVSANHVEQVFDQVIISSPPLATREFLDMSDQEKEVVSGAKHLFFHTTLFYGRDLPRDVMLFFPEWARSGHPGAPTCIANFHPTHNIFQGYQLHDGTVSEEKLEEALRRVVWSVGGTIEQTVLRETFTYFTHFPEEDLDRLKPYERLESLQGKNSTFFIGGAVSAESAEDTAQYAQQLIRKHFGN